MELIVDLHIHSHYSRATSKETHLAGLYKWGKIKGINIIGTGDFTHPEWFAELRENLEPAEPGLFRLREDLAQAVDKMLPESIRHNLIRFILTVEIATIYSKAGKVRKLHNLIIAPSFETAAAINSQLERIGNLKADGRPILGLDSKELLRITIETDREALFVPAHIWTPWFGMFGSKSGFDSIEEAFEELAPEIKAIETGLSSDPFMNWRLDQLKNLTIISNSDAHSPPKLGREASVVLCKLNYSEIMGAIRTNDHRFVGTIEFFPQEGKYHYDGHRSCNVKLNPVETKKHQGICPVCGKPVVVGVDYRVSELATQPENYRPINHKQVEYIIPLPEIIAELKGASTTSKKVAFEFEKVYSVLGNEFNLIRNIKISDIKQAGFPELAKAIDLMRAGKVHIDPGYDGVYGTIKLFDTNADRLTFNDQIGFEW